MVRPTSNPQRESVFFRASLDLVKRLDLHVERMVRQFPGTSPTRSDAIRTLLIQALDQAEQVRPER